MPIAQLGQNSQSTQQIYTNDQGERFVLDANGDKMFVKTDANNNQYFENKLGVKQLIPANALKQQPVFMNDKGEVYVKVNGKSQKVLTDQFGVLYVQIAKGEKVPVAKQAVPVFQAITEKGERFILDKNGKKVKVLTDNQGVNYVLGDSG